MAFSEREHLPQMVFMRTEADQACGLIRPWLTVRIAEGGVAPSQMMHKVVHRWQSVSVRGVNEVPYDLAIKLKAIALDSLTRLAQYPRAYESSVQSFTQNRRDEFTPLFERHSWFGAGSGATTKGHALGCISVERDDLPFSLDMVDRHSYYQPNVLLTKLLELGAIPDNVKEELYLAAVRACVHEVYAARRTSKDEQTFDVALFGTTFKVTVDVRAFTNLVAYANIKHRRSYTDPLDRNEYESELLLVLSAGRLSPSFISALDRLALKQAEKTVGAFALGSIFNELMNIGSVTAKMTPQGAVQLYIQNDPDPEDGGYGFGYVEQAEINMEEFDALIKAKLGIPLSDGETVPTFESKRQQRSETLDPGSRLNPSFVQTPLQTAAAEQADTSKAPPKQIRRTRKKLKPDQLKPDPKIDDSRTT